MAHSLIYIKSENSENFSVIHENAFKLGHNIKHDDLNSLMALSDDKVGHVTCYECFIGLSRNWKWGGEMTCNRYTEIEMLWQLSCCPSYGSGRNGRQWCNVSEINSEIGHVTNYVS